MTDELEPFRSWAELLHGVVAQIDEGALNALDGNVWAVDAYLSRREIEVALLARIGLPITCARCGRSILAETDNDADNGAMEVCSRCMHEIDLSRPVEGVVLTREEAAMAAASLRYASGRSPEVSPRAALAARLEAAS